MTPQPETPDAAPHDETQAPRRPSRRAPDPAERQRDADRTRQRIVDAALAEFSEKGYAGARVREIAERAGVNSQLISYYFGGKEGLYGELLRQWHEWEGEVEQADLPFADLVVSYLEAGYIQPERMRMFLWEELTRTGRRGEPAPGLDDKRDGTANGDERDGTANGAASSWTGPTDKHAAGGRSEPEASEVADLRRRQAAGEIAADLDPAYLLVAVMAAVAAPSTMPSTIERVCGVRADSPQFRARYEDLVRTLIEHLREPPPAG